MKYTAVQSWADNVSDTAASTFSSWVSIVVIPTSGTGAASGSSQVAGVFVLQRCVESALVVCKWLGINEVDRRTDVGRNVGRSSVRAVDDRDVGDFWKRQQIHNVLAYVRFFSAYWAL